jgi:hypothetical protein
MPMEHGVFKNISYPSANHAHYYICGNSRECNDWMSNENFCLAFISSSPVSPFTCFHVTAGYSVPFYFHGFVHQM